MKIEHVEISELHEYKHNSRTHSATQVAEIAESIKLFGFVNPVLVGDQGRVIAGHGRLSAAVTLNLETVPVCKLGDMWQLGDHYLMCGSSVDGDQVKKLLSAGGTRKADMVFTDPPYLMDFRGSLRGDGSKSFNGKYKPIQNDKLSKVDGIKFLDDVAGVIKQHCRGAWYICFYRLGIDWIFDALKSNGMKWRNLIIWNKGHITLSNSDYKSMYEPIVYGFENDYEPILYGWNDQHSFHGEKGEKDIWECSGELSVWDISRTRLNDLHPTMKPISLCERAICNSSKRNESVLDLFGGSGSTLIACEKSGRNAYLMELEPSYCDVIILRYQAYTGKQATRIKDGVSYDSIAQNINKGGGD